ncbi:LamG-like jellyroll fold domain-containing protein [Pseudofulvibacter geojedonensis]|uniref:LamG-like jellyroll fold domain-containing protein n=1 Tax=Pseudofulvibacter geojedonensis TaxID=1123758 RepID=A0ABW3HYM6_9FLAO
MKKRFFLLFLLLVSGAFAQTYEMQNGSFSTCSGTFYDSGGEWGLYASNENYTITFCPSTPGDAIQLDFSKLDVEGETADFMVIYNGDSASEIEIGTYTVNPGIITANNLTGCLTITFVSDGSTRRTGWEAEISCITPCQNITSVLDSVSVPVNTDNIIELCEGDSFTVTGSGVFSDSGVGATYEWNFGDGSALMPGTSATYSYASAGIYLINLNITDSSPEACTNTNYINLIAHVYGEPNFSTLAASTVCAGVDNTISVAASGQTYESNCSPPVVGTTFLPDGNGAEYTTCIDVSCYGANETVTSIDDIVEICLNMEHSYFGDLDIIIEAPNGQSAVLVDYALTDNNSIHLGEALDHIVTATDVALGPGIGYDYCFAMNGSVTLDHAPEVNGGQSLAAGTYLPDESFNSLIGAPLNGQWCIRVKDNLLSDNGYIFSWDINFASETDPSQGVSSSYTQTIVSETWQPDSTIVSSSGGNLTINPTVLGNQCYTYEVTDNAGCMYSQQYCVNVINCTSNIDFDGVDDYINTAAFLGGMNEATMMTWIKLDDDFDGGEIMGQRNFRLYLDSTLRLKGFVRTDSGAVSSVTTPNALSPILTKNLWYHVALIYNGNTGLMSLCLNGVEVLQMVGLTGNSLHNGNNWNANYDFEIGRNTYNSNNYFEGAIYETRVYNKALTAIQVQEQIYQEIVDNGGVVRGTIIPKDIANGTLNWNNLQLYYKMDLVAPDGTTPDNSSIGRIGMTNNMTTSQEQSAPLPYVANNSGNWTDVSTWQYGDKWDITNLPNEDWIIVHIKSNTKVVTTNSHSLLGLLLDSDTELEIQNNQLLNNTKYLKLDGLIDLVGESQLVQTTSSILDVVSAGKIEREQSGKADVYSYNYWSSPVSPQNSTINNSNYTVSSVLFDATDVDNLLPINFVDGYNGAATTPISLADFWMFKYVNQPDDYVNWSAVGANGAIKVGEGYTQKGTGTSALSQNYAFVGKPNNGTIKLPLDADNLYLVGNPYPSALDANQFIIDNSAVIQTNGDFESSGATTGALYFWEHWGGGSHNVLDYQGGYATYNLAGATYAIPDPGVSSIGSGTILPLRYIPVGQGFIVQGSTDGGNIEFNNGQRAFEREMDGNSVFISRNTSNNSTPRLAEDIVLRTSDDIKRMYFNITTPQGPKRQLLLALKEGLSLGVDYGYDAKLIDDNKTDCAWFLNNEKYVIQSIGEIDIDLELPLYIKAITDGEFKVSLSNRNIALDKLTVYFVDKYSNTTNLLQLGEQHQFFVSEGVYDDRYFLKFKNDIKDSIELALNMSIYYSFNSQEIVIENDQVFTAENIILYNILGQEVQRFANKYEEVNKILLPINVEAGVYLIKFLKDNSTEISEKLIIK